MRLLPLPVRDERPGAKQPSLRPILIIFAWLCLGAYLLWHMIPKAPQEIYILAPDVIIHLGDDPTLTLPWSPIYRNRDPSIWWTGEFYLKTVEDGPWLLTMEVFQVNQRYIPLKINDRYLEPPFITNEDNWQGKWVVVSFRVPPGVLQPGLNTITIRTTRELPVYQAPIRTLIWDDFQFRRIVLRRSWTP